MKALLVLFAFAAFAAAGCGSAATEEAAPPEVTATTDATRPLAPEVEGTTIDGDRVALKDFRGRAVFVNVWASW